MTRKYLYVMHNEGAFRRGETVFARSLRRRPNGLVLSHCYNYDMFLSMGEPRLELDVHDFGIMWNYFGIH